MWRQTNAAPGHRGYTLAALPKDEDGGLPLFAFSKLAKLAEAHDIVAVGPGLDRTDKLAALLGEMVVRIQKPMVIDADGLNAFASRADDIADRKADDHHR